MRRMVLVPLLIVLAVLAIGGGIGYYIYDNYMYYNTDDAQVTGNIVSVNAPASGTLTTLDVQLGQKVAKGDLLATITPPTTVNATGATVTPPAIKVLSPSNGTIIETAAVQGQDVAPGLAILELTDLSSLTVTAYVDEGALNNINVGQQVDISIDAYSGTSFTGHVKQIVQATAGTFSLLPVQDNASGNFTKVGQRIPVIISLDGNTGKDILPGMSAEVTIHLH
jgi:multidrug resistance efflux pump